jgi:hypothetical protein
MVAAQHDDLCATDEAVEHGPTVSSQDETWGRAGHSGQSWSQRAVALPEWPMEPGATRPGRRPSVGWGVGRSRSAGQGRDREPPRPLNGSTVEANGSKQKRDRLEASTFFWPRACVWCHRVEGRRLQVNYSTIRYQKQLAYLTSPIAILLHVSGSTALVIAASARRQSFASACQPIETSMVDFDEFCRQVSDILGCYLASQAAYEGSIPLAPILGRCHLAGEQLTRST